MWDGCSGQRENLSAQYLKLSPVEFENLCRRHRNPFCYFIYFIYFLLGAAVAVKVEKEN